jgi:hypothetical protein
VVAAAVLLGGAVALRSAVSGDAAPVPPAERVMRETPPPPPDNQGEVVASGYHDGEPWWVTARIDKRSDLCVGFITLEGGTGGEGCGPGSSRGRRGEPIGLNIFYSYDLSAPTVYYGQVRPDIAALDFKQDGVTDRVATIAAPPGSGFDLRFYVFFGGPVQEVVGLDAKGEAVEHIAVTRTFLPDLDTEEVVASGSHAGIDWELTASPLSEGPCYGLEYDLGGGGGCASAPGPGWRGDVNQYADPKRAETGPVWGAVPPRTDDVRVVQGGTEIPAVIFRPDGHDFAYYIVWIPDAFAPGTVRFNAGREVSEEPLCVATLHDGGKGRKSRHGVTCSSLTGP